MLMDIAPASEAIDYPQAPWFSWGSAGSRVFTSREVYLYDRTKKRALTVERSQVERPQ